VCTASLHAFLLVKSTLESPFKNDPLNVHYIQVLERVDYYMDTLSIG